MAKGQLVQPPFLKAFHLRPGVLTKADRIDEGDHHPWLTIAANGNRAWKLTHGWYVTKQCSTTELSQNLSPEEVLAKERSFFKDKEPWKGLEQDRFGTPKLADALSDLLSQMIRDKYFPIPSSLNCSLPEVHATISEQLRKVQETLAGLPEPFSDNPQLRLLHECRAFSQELRQYAVGANDYGQFVRKIRNIFQLFRREILETTPSFEVGRTGGPEAAENDNPKVVHLSTADGHSVESCPGNDLSFSGSWLTVARDQITLQNVRDLINNTRILELVIRTPSRVDEHLISKTTSKWEKIALKCAEEIKNELYKVVVGLCKSHFGRFRASGLYDQVRYRVTKAFTDMSKCCCHENA